MNSLQNFECNKQPKHAHEIHSSERYNLAKLECVERNVIQTPWLSKINYTESEDWDYKCRKLPNMEGCYIVSCMPIRFEKEELTPLYVGRSGNIRQRFYKHKPLKDEVMNYIGDNAVVFIGLILDTLSFKGFDDLELFLINSLHPKFNKAF